MVAIEGLTIRPVETIAEYDSCEEIQRHAWGYHDIDIVPTNELISAQRAGGLVIGAFLPEGRMVGFCFGFLGRDHESQMLYHSSRMVGVDPSVRGRGVAQALKLAQRELCLKQGVNLIRWTFEPLEAANATLNLRKLGAEAIAYIRDLYGSGTTSPLHQGLGTDRLLVEWRLLAERRPPLRDGPRIEIPGDIQSLKRTPVLAERERARVRDDFERAFQQGLVATDFRDGGYIFSSARSS